MLVYVRYVRGMLIQWNLIITVTLGPNLAGCYIEVAFLLSGIQKIIIISIVYVQLIIHNISTTLKK